MKSANPIFRRTCLLSSPRDSSQRGTTRSMAERESIFLLSAGVHTTSMAMMWSLRELFLWLEEHPEDEARLTDSDFVLRVAEEAMRLHPVVPGFPRLATADIDLSAGTHVPRGEIAVIRSGPASMEPAIYGEDSDTFNPHRSVPAGVYNFGYAFGTGPHMCYGMPLVMGTGGLNGSLVYLLEASVASRSTARSGPHHAVARFAARPVPGRGRDSADLSRRLSAWARDRGNWWPELLTWGARSRTLREWMSSIFGALSPWRKNCTSAALPSVCTSLLRPSAVASRSWSASPSELFVRRYHAVALTSSGQALVEPARELLKAFVKLKETARAATEGLTRTFRIGGTHYSPPEAIEAVLAEILRVFPTAETEIVLATSAGLVALLERDELDLAVVYLPLESSSVNTLPFACCELSVAMLADDELAGASQLTLKDLAGRTVILQPTRSQPAAMTLFVDIWKQLVSPRSMR